MRKNDCANNDENPMSVNKTRIKRFALVWKELYKNYKNIPNNYFEDNFFIGEEMRELGFEMDCGISLKEKFPDVELGKNDKKWEKILMKIDMQTLGNAIFSQWRYLNHWGIETKKEESLGWFVKSLNRLAELVE